MLIYAGIDEAGYGPMLGPLCVACAVFAIDDWQAGDPAPDLWRLLGAGVARRRKNAGRRIVIADSKQLKLPNSSRTLHPLALLERGVAACLGELPPTDAALHSNVGAALGKAPWYGGKPLTLPLANDAALLRFAANRLRLVCAEAGVRLLCLRCLTLTEDKLNESIQRTQSKAAASLSLVMQHISDVWDTHADAHPRIVIDRQGGRTHYGGPIARLLPGATIEIVAETAELARYHLRRGTNELTLSFSTGAEGRHLPVALASMLAKYIRELAMLRFNRYFKAQMPELKPTAGYVQDARRWLREASDLVAGIDREALIRRL